MSQDILYQCSRMRMLLLFCVIIVTKTLHNGSIRPSILWSNGLMDIVTPVTLQLYAAWLVLATVTHGHMVCRFYMLINSYVLDGIRTKNWYSNALQ